MQRNVGTIAWNDSAFIQAVGHPEIFLGRDSDVSSIWRRRKGVWIWINRNYIEKCPRRTICWESVKLFLCKYFYFFLNYPIIYKFFNHKVKSKARILQFKTWKLLWVSDIFSTVSVITDEYKSDLQNFVIFLNSVFTILARPETKSMAHCLKVVSLTVKHEIFQ